MNAKNMKSTKALTLSSLTSERHVEHRNRRQKGIDGASGG